MQTTSTSIQTGNANQDSANRGWLLGHFIPKELGLRHTEDLELKLSIHKTDEKRGGWVTGETRTTICIALSGRHELQFRDRTVLLSKPGDYVIWGPGVDHTSQTLEEGQTLTVRWPSIAGYERGGDQA